MDEHIENYIVDILCVTRVPGRYQPDRLGDAIECSDSSRPTIYLSMETRVQAVVRRQGYVTHQDVSAVLERVRIETA